MGRGPIEPGEMSTRTVVVVTALVVLAGAAAAAPAGALDAVAAPAQSDAGGNASNASFGASVSAFMQASAAETEGTVENGMFAAAFNRTADRQARTGLVTGRAKALEMRLDRLREERAALLNESGNLTVAERAKAARLAARIESLRESINQTETAANRAGVNVTRLDELRKSAGQLAGPEVAALATGLVDSPGRGPPGEVGPPNDRGPEGNEVGPPENAGNGSDGSGNGPPFGGNESDGDHPRGGPGEGGNGSDGPPDHAGNASDGGQ